ncbi:hypothetical protein P3S68_004115 [Capsicum galapagoense]
MEKLAELILIPSPAMGHVAQMLELAKLFFSRNHQLSITVLIMKLPDYIDAVSGPFVDSVAASSSSDRLRFFELPAADPTPEWSSKTRGHFVYRLVQSQKSHIRDFLISQRPGNKLTGLVVDMLCTPLMDVADEFGISIYFLEDECRQDVSNFKNSDSSTLIIISQLGLPNSSYCIANEIHALDAYNNMSRSEQEPLPLIYPIGPILNQSKSRSESEEAETTNWLDEQPLNSVVLICFGSQGSLQAEQVNEIAIALENIGCRILKGKWWGGFPQLKVLSHEAVGGFVSHCGWNSILESIWFGVPIATWPLHSEQQVNAFQLVKEVGVAVEFTLDYCERNKDQPMITAEAIKKGLTKLMETNSTVRDKAKEMKEKSRGSIMEGGSSYLSLGKLIDELLNNAAL